MIENHEFPGNYRELENILRRAVILNDLTGSDLGHYLRASITTDVAGINKSDPRQENSPDSSYGDVPSIPLKDILDYADKVRQSIVEAKLQEILKSGK